MKKAKQFMMKNLRMIICLIILILLIILMGNFFQDNLVHFDNFYYKHISKLITPRMTFLVKVLTNFGNAFSFITIILFMAFFLKNKKYSILTIINLFMVFILNVILKFIFARPRPTDINLINELGYSFPSAHAMISTAFYGFIIYLFWHTNISKKEKYFYTISLCLLIIGICISRIYLGVHFTSDVLGGILFALLYLMLYIKIIKKEL